MPRTRWRIPQAEARSYRLLIRQLNKGGARLDYGPLRPEKPIALSFFDCYAYTVQYGSVYVLWVAFLGLASNTILAGFDLSSVDFDLAMDFLEDPRLARSESQSYYLPDRTPFDRSQVLNHRVGEDGILQRGHQLEGVLLAQAFEPIPQRYPPASRLPAVLSVAARLGKLPSGRSNFVCSHHTAAHAHPPPAGASSKGPSYPPPRARSMTRRGPKILRVRPTRTIRRLGFERRYTYAGRPSNLYRNFIS